MFDYKRLFGIAAILFGIGFILQSIMPAKANPTGPSVSYGSNPWKSFWVIGNGTFLTTSASEMFVITTILQNSTNCALEINGNNAFNGQWAYSHSNASSRNAVVSGNLHYVIEPNSSLLFAGVGCGVGQYLEGYYTQP